MTARMDRVTIALARIEMTGVRRTRRYPEFEAAPEPKSLVWLRSGTPDDVERARAYAVREGYTVFTYPTGEHDPCGRARREVSEQYEQTVREEHAKAETAARQRDIAYRKHLRVEHKLHGSDRRALTDADIEDFALSRTGYQPEHIHCDDCTAYAVACGFTVAAKEQQP